MSFVPPHYQTSDDILQQRLQKWLMRRSTPSAVRRVGELPISIGTDKGVKRSDNQDRVAVLRMRVSAERSFSAVVLCDGMGGMEEGSVCASIAVSAFMSACVRYQNVELEDRLLAASDYANAKIYSLFKGRGGSTISAIVRDTEYGQVGVNIGDSRIYTYGNEKLSPKTIDDTLIAQLRQNDRFVDESRRNELLQFVGMGSELQPHIIKIHNTGDYYVLTSDGAHSVGDSILQLIIKNASEPAIVVRRLLDLSKWCGGDDNASVAIGDLSMSSVDDGDVGLIQCWDAFGELQFFDNISAPLYYKPETWADQPSLLEAAQRLAKAINPLPSPELAEKKYSRKTKRGAKSKTKAEKKPAKSDTKSRPQLKIDFVRDESEKK